jgi:hypothetical protein
MKVSTPPSAPTPADVGVTPNAHDDEPAASCVTVRIWPAIVNVPDRVLPLLGAAVIVTVASPVPKAPAATVRKPLLLAEVQPQFICVVTSNVSEPPLAGAVTLAGVTEYAHCPPAPPCVRVTVWPAMLAVPDRGAPPFAAAVRVTTPLPLANAPFVTVRNALLLAAVQSQPGPSVATPNDAVPPAALTLADAGVTA